MTGGKKFPNTLYAMVNAGFEEVGWTAEGDAIRIANPERLAANVLPRFFRTSSYASLHRSLNSYDFHKASPSTWKHPLFHRDRPQDIERIERKQTLSSAQKSIKAQLEEERRQAAILQRKALQLESELRALHEADSNAQRKLVVLQEQAAAATLDLNTKLAHPLMPSYLEPDAEDDMEMELSLTGLLGADVTPQDLGLSHQDLKPEAARIIDEDLATMFGNSCKLAVSASLWRDFEFAARLTDEDLRKAFAELDPHGTGMISRHQFQDLCLKLWMLGSGSTERAKDPIASDTLRKMYQALEHAAQAEPEYAPIRLERHTSSSAASAPSPHTSERGSLTKPHPGGPSRISTELRATTEESEELTEASSPAAGSAPDDEDGGRDRLISLSEESMQTGHFRFEEFRAMMHAWKDWHGWKEQGLSRKVDSGDTLPMLTPDDDAQLPPICPERLVPSPPSKLFPDPTPT